jgi:hypothetical protein
MFSASDVLSEHRCDFLDLMIDIDEEIPVTEMSLRRGTELDDIRYLPWMHFIRRPHEMTQRSDILRYICIVLDHFSRKFADFGHDIIIRFLEYFHAWKVNVFRIIIAINRAYSLP